METLDDSQKDNEKGSDVVDKAINGKEDDLETVKLDNSEVTLIKLFYFEISNSLIKFYNIRILLKMTNLKTNRKNL